MTAHWEERISERVPDIADIRRRATAAATTYQRGAVAVRLLTLGAHRGDTAADYWQRDTSNGDEVWAVIREGSVCTVMLRRSTQDRRPWAFNVQRVVLSPAI